MKKNNCVERKMTGITKSRWCMLEILLISQMLCGLCSIVQADVGNNIPELPSIEVRPLFSLPVPIEAVKPRLPARLTGAEVEMTFKISKNGQPYAIRYPWYSDQDKGTLGATMTQVLKHWRFKPALDRSGNAHVVKVVLPVKVVTNGNGNADRYASISLSDLALVAVLD